MKKILLLIAFTTISMLSFSQQGLTPAQTKTIWEPRVIPSAQNIDSTFNAVVFKTENPYFVTVADFVKTTSTTVSTVTGLISNANLEAGVTYAFEAVLFGTSAGTGGYKFATGGTATATNILYSVTAFDNGGDTICIAANVATQGATGALALTSAVALPSIAAKIAGTITVSAAGTFGITFAQASANSTSTIKAGSYLFYRKINQ